MNQLIHLNFMKRILLIILSILFSLLSYSQRYLPKLNYRLDYSDFIVDWDSINRVPRLVYYIVYADSLKELPRVKFKEDRWVKSTSRIRDYFRSGYDKGHMLPHASAWNKRMRNDCYFMTNMAPQMPGLNRGLWRSIEMKERELSRPYCYVMTGAIVSRDAKRINGRVSIPEAFWKVIYNPVRGILQCYYVEQHDRGRADSYEIDLGYIEFKSGIDFEF